MDVEVAGAEDVAEVVVHGQEMVHSRTYPHGNDLGGCMDQGLAGHLVIEIFQQLQ
jgi:hypothetical protein